MVDTFNPRYTFTKRGRYYFCQEVATDSRRYHAIQRIVQSLRTKSPTRAKHSAKVLMARLEDYWLNPRLNEAQITAAHLLRHAPSQNLDSTLPTIKNALQLHQRVKGEGRDKTSFTQRSKSVAYLEQCLGCRSLNQYSGADAATFRDWLRNKGLSTVSVQRNFTIIKAILSGK